MSIQGNEYSGEQEFRGIRIQGEWIFRENGNLGEWVFRGMGIQAEWEFRRIRIQGEWIFRRMEIQENGNLGEWIFRGMGIQGNKDSRRIDIQGEWVFTGKFRERKFPLAIGGIVSQWQIIVTLDDERLNIPYGIVAERIDRRILQNVHKLSDHIDGALHELFFQHVYQSFPCLPALGLGLILPQDEMEVK